MTMLQHDQDPGFRIIRSSDESQHRCKKPTHRDRRQNIGVGTIIECVYCHTQWQCMSENSGDQRDPINPPTLTWKMYRVQTNEGNTSATRR